MKNFLFASLLTISLASFAAEEAGPTPRMADGKPDLSGVWWTGGDLGSAGYGSTTDRSRGLQYELYTNLYNEESKARMATLNDKDDPTLFCKPTAFGTLMVRFFVAAFGLSLSREARCLVSPFVLGPPGAAFGHQSPALSP